MTPQELKNSILQLAIQGKLVEQRSEEGTAEELYRQIQQEKQRLIKEGKIKKEKPLPEITEEEKPFDIPESWIWCYVGEVFQHNTGKALNGSDRSGDLMTYITTSNLYWDRFELDKLKEMPFTESEIEKCTIRKGDLLVCEGGDYGRAAIWPYDKLMRIQNHIHRLRPYAPVSVRYFYYCFYLYKNSGMIAGKGIGIQGLSSNALHILKMPLPPLAEQKRIVAKIEELLPLIDRYEKAWSRLEEFNKRFPDDIQKSILQMAIQGKLVEQRPEEGTGEELAKIIAKKKLELIQLGTVPKKTNTKPFFSHEELQEFDIPNTWQWVQLSDVSIIQEGAGIRKWQYRDSGTQILCVTNILEGSIDLDKKKLYISTDEYMEKYQHLTPHRGDIVCSCSGGSWGKTAIFDSDEVMMLNTSTLRLRFFGDLADNNYLYYLCKSPFFKRQLELQLSGMQPNFGYAHYSRIMLPLPPFAEQKRIVDKIIELLPLCSKLSAAK